MITCVFLPEEKRAKIRKYFKTCNNSRQLSAILDFILIMLFSTFIFSRSERLSSVIPNCCAESSYKK